MADEKKRFTQHLKIAWLDNNPVAVFQALNIYMDYIPYKDQYASSDEMIEIPVWLLQAFREIAAYRLDNPKVTSSGPTGNEKLKSRKYHKIFACAISTKKARTLRDEDGKKLKGYKMWEKAKKFLFDDFEYELEPETIKKYAEKFARADKISKNTIISDSAGNNLAEYHERNKYIFLTKDDEDILQQVLSEGNNLA